MSKLVANRKDILIAIVAAAGEKGLDPVQLQKSVFLVGEKFEGCLPEDFYQFKPHDYGPMAVDVYRDIEACCYDRSVDVRADADNRPNYLVREQTKGALPDRLDSEIRRIVAWVTCMSFNELIRAIYYRYPEQQENSKFRWYSDKLAMEESLKRSLHDMAAGRTRPVEKLIAELSPEHPL